MTSRAAEFCVSAVAVNTASPVLLMAQAESNNQCNANNYHDPACETARRYHLRRANIASEHDFKTEWGALPNSRFDICACSDGSIKIDLPLQNSSTLN